MPRKQLRLVQAWIELHHDELIPDWELAVDGESPYKIADEKGRLKFLFVTLKPLDIETILESVVKTGRCVIVQEAARTRGVGAEIAAQLAERGLLSLQAPIERMAGYDCIMPLYRLESHYLPDTERRSLAFA